MLVLVYLDGGVNLALKAWELMRAAKNVSETFFTQSMTASNKNARDVNVFVKRVAA